MPLASAIPSSSSPPRPGPPEAASSSSSAASAAGLGSPGRAAASSGTDTSRRPANLLRRAARLVHCLQKERGSSCALCASASSIGDGTGSGGGGAEAAPAGEEGQQQQQPKNKAVVVPSRILRSVTSSRRDTDAALAGFGSCSADNDLRGNGGEEERLPVGRSLERIRGAVDRAAGLGGTERATSSSAAAAAAAAVTAAAATESGGIGAALRRAESSASATGGGGGTGGGAAGGFHPILLMFNGLLSNVIRVYIVEQCEEERRRRKERARQQRRRRRQQQQASKSQGVKSKATPGAEYAQPLNDAPHHPQPPYGRGRSPTSLASIIPSPNSLRALRAAVGMSALSSSDPTTLVYDAPGPSGYSPPDVLATGQGGQGGGGPPPLLPRHGQPLPPPPSHTRWGSFGGAIGPLEQSLGGPPAPPSDAGGGVRERCNSAGPNSFPTKRRPPTSPNRRTGQQVVPPHHCPPSPTSSSNGDGQRLMLGRDNSNNSDGSRFFCASSSADGDTTQATALLSLLLSFVRLKESTGIERAALSSLMALGADSGEIPNMLFSDLVLEEENQRRVVRQLRRAARRARIDHGGGGGDADANDDDDDRNDHDHDGPNAHRDEHYRSLLLLVEESVTPSPEMEALQDMIRLDFDLEGFHSAMRIDEFWGLITLYIDRLHALELLIIEELECCFATEDAAAAAARRRRRSEGLGVVDSAGPGDAAAAIEAESANGTGPLAGGRGGSEARGGGAVGGDAARSSAELRSLLLGAFGVDPGRADARGDVAARIESMPPEQLKETLLAVLSRSSSGDGTGSLGDSEGAGAAAAAAAAEATTASPLHALDGGEREDVAAKAASASDEKGPPSPGRASQTMPDTDVAAPSAEDWDIDPYEIEFRKRIGRGVAGTTYLAKWNGQTVAVKVAAITDLGIDGWHTECRSLRRLHHPNVVRMLGSMYNPNPQTFGLVLEYCESGDLKSALSRWTPKNFFFKVAADIANGMAYLHKKNIIHRDLKPANVLIHGDVPSGSYTAKLADFGVATMTQGSADGEHTAETGTYRWMAPEVIRHESYSFAADVYSYGLVVWQLLTREEPFSKHSQIEAAGLVALELARPPFPHGTPHGVASFIEICWSEDPYNRMPFEQIRTALWDLNKNLTNREKTWLETAFGHPVYEARADSCDDADAPNIDVLKGMKGKAPKVNVRSKSWTDNDFRVDLCEDEVKAKAEGRRRWNLLSRKKKTAFW